MQHNNMIFKLLQEKTLKASKELAQRFGEPEILKGYGRRNTTLMSVAPTKSSSFILGSVSPSIEPFKSNYYVKDLSKIKVVYKNPFLEALLKRKGLDRDDIWESILLNDGSVQHLTELTEDEKEVFKTFSEIQPAFRDSTSSATSEIYRPRAKREYYGASRNAGKRPKSALPHR